MEQSDLKNRHAKLLNDISDEMDPNSPECEKFVSMIPTLGIGKGLVARKKTLLEKLDLLSTKGKIKPGDYNNLKKLLRDSGNDNIVTLIEAAENDMKVIFSRNSDSAGNSAALNVNRSGTSSSVQPGPSGNEVKKRRYEEVDEGDIMIGGHKYYNYKNKKGYLLILESRENRKATEYDTGALRQFFRNTLHFEVDDPRSQVKQDFTLDEFKRYLTAARDKLNGSLGSEYYCFICVILSHGNVQGIMTRDEQFLSTEYIRKEFTNDKIPSFTGKPKVFLIQACRGLADQAGELIDEEDDEPQQQRTEEDEADVPVTVPHDADTLMAFSTTPGYKSNRRVLPTSELRGSWFIQHCLNVFRDSYEDERNHLEEMLITVRDEVSKMQKSNRAVQMPCVWSTLRARLRLVVSS